MMFDCGRVFSSVSLKKKKKTKKCQIAVVNSRLVASLVLGIVYTRLGFLTRSRASVFLCAHGILSGRIEFLYG